LSRLQVAGHSALPHPLKVTQIVRDLGVIGMRAPIFALVPVVHLLLPGADRVVVVFVVTGAPVDRSSASSSPAPLPGGVRSFSGLGRPHWL